MFWYLFGSGVHADLCGERGGQCAVLGVSHLSDVILVGGIGCDVLAGDL